MDPATVPSWNRATSETLESAAVEDLPLVIWFMGDNDTDTSITDRELADMSKSEAVFVKIECTKDREKSPWAEDSIVPTSKLLSDNPSREYDIRPGQSTVIIADSHGNEHYRQAKMPAANRLKSYLEKVSTTVERENEKLQRYLDQAREQAEEGDRRKAIRYLLKNFDDGNGPVGLEAQEESIRLYHEIMDEVRTEVASHVEKGDVDALRQLMREVRKTDVEDEIDEAIDELR